MRVLQINVTLNSGSTGRIASDIGKMIVEKGGQSFIAYGRQEHQHQPNAIKIGNRWDQANHLLQTRLFDRHGFLSNKATRIFLQRISELKPDVIHLHNLHGYYLNVELLFAFLQVWKKPVVWTLHDCWAFTGHCTYFTHVNCQKWKTQCYQCPLKKEYPSSIGLDRSKNNFFKKKEAFSSLKNLALVTVSDWLKSMVSSSFLNDKECTTIYNGVNLEVFRPMSSSSLSKYGIVSTYILAVANIWTKRKGLDDLKALRSILTPSLQMVVIGLSQEQIRDLPPGMVGIERLQNVNDLAELYSGASVFVNPSKLETFGMVTAEALACGVPVVVYDATASPELVAEGTGYVVPEHDIAGMATAIAKIMRNGTSSYRQRCRDAATAQFDKEKQYEKYFALYKSLL
jgi:putative colanic acid biosynthesis glycosyltransferase